MFGLEICVMILIYLHRPNNEIDVSVDAGWQKRGSGRAYDSLSGEKYVNKLLACTCTNHSSCLFNYNVRLYKTITYMYN